MIRGEALTPVGGFDEGYFLYFEETELCVRLRKAGWRLVCDTAALAHQEPGQPSLASWTRNRTRFVARNFPARVLGLELLGQLEEILRNAASRRADDRRSARSMLRGLWGAVAGTDPRRLADVGHRRDPRGKGAD
jgi:GT2 family glycosyltransferase